MIKKHISFSEYRLYKSCPFKHHLTKDLGYTEPSNEFLVFGSAIHATIEEIIKKQPSKILWKSIFEKHLLNESNDILTKTYFGKLFTKQGVDIIKELNFFERFKEWEVIGVEEELYEELLNYEGNIINFKGIIDLVLKKEDEYLILDWKTSSKPWDVEKKKEDKDFFGQLALYRHFYAKKYNIPPHKIQTRFVNLIRDPIKIQQFDIELSDEFCDYILQDIINVTKEIITTTEHPKAKHQQDKTINCSNCFFHNNICNNDPFQQVKPYDHNETNKKKT